jgi:D-alanyl-D-alanine carboxypeptidase
MPDLDRGGVLDACRYLDSWLAFRRHAERVPGVQAAVLHDGVVVLSTAHGVTSTVSGEPLRPDHLFRIASHSKTFTATAIMQLFERGALRLDDTVGERLPELASSPIGAVTVRELLAHGGGVIRDGHDGDFWQLFREFPDRAELVRVAADAADVLPRNDRFKYSNIGYSVLGLVIEEASGQPFGAYVREHIIDRLGLVDTGPEYDPGRAGDFAGGHTGLGYADARIPIEHVDTGAMAAATGCYSTASDLVRYAAAHFIGDERLVSESSKRQMHHAHWKVTGVDEEYGFGFQVATIGERRVLGHGGGYPGHITRTYFDPTDRLAVSVFTNAIDGPAATWASVAVKLIDLAAGGRAEHKGDTGATSAERATFCGRFATMWGVFDVVDLGGRLFQLSPSLPDPTLATTRLDVVDADTLRTAETPGYGAPGELIRFERDGDGAVVSVRAGSGITGYPFEAYRAAIAARSAVTVGRPIVP